MVAHILYGNYINKNGKGMSIGGIQTYITRLSDVLKECGYGIVIYQTADFDFEKEIDGIVVKGFNKPLKPKDEPELLVKNCMKSFDRSEDILIFATDFFVRKAPGCKSIAIQHGITWDIPQKECGILTYMKIYLHKAVSAWKTARRIGLTDRLICVDYNFVNWYRALVAYPKTRLEVIPNFAEVAEDISDKQTAPETIRIIFARRFFEYRGTRIFADAIIRVLEKYDNIDVTMAGEGEDEELLKCTLAHYPNVHFIKYESNDSLRIHKDKHIAVVPTVGSEGTSLSLLEAMSASCAVICSNVGGMSNIVLDHYNGIMIMPTENELYNALCKLIENENLRHSLAQKANETVREAFSYKQWHDRWKKIIEEL